MDLSHLARHPGLKGRSVFVSGGGSGIGAGIVEAFVDQGSKVAFVDIDKAKSEKLVADLKAQYGNAPLFIPATSRTFRPCRRRSRRRPRRMATSPLWSTTRPTTSATNGKS